MAPSGTPSGATWSTSSSLIGRVKARDGDAWQRLCRLYGPMVYRWARQAGLQDPDAADVGQEVFRTVADRIGAFEHDRPGDTFRGWLWTITRNKLGDHFRRRASQPQAAGGTDALERLERLPDALDEFESQSTVSPPGFDARADLLHRTLEAIRDEFEPSTWQAFWRVTVEGQSPAHVGDDLGMTPQAVRQAKYRVLRRLRAELGEVEG